MEEKKTDLDNVAINYVQKVPVGVVGVDSSLRSVKLSP
jgi:hypothetical protein